MNNLTITKELIDGIHKALDKGLIKGLGVQKEGEMCVEALICYKLGLPHSDNPPCVHQEVRSAKIALNDCDWSSNKARAEGMRKLAIAQLGSNFLNDNSFKKLLFLKSCQNILPILIQVQIKDKTQVENINNLKDWIVKFKASTLETVEQLWRDFYNYNYNYNYNNYNNNYYYNNYNNYNNNYYYNYYNNNYNYKLGDSFLLVIADTILQTLIELKSPGVEWLNT